MPEPFLIHVDGEAIEAQPGDTVAAALLRAGITTFTRSVKYHRPRGPFCLGGSCGQCLMRIDGAPSVQACRTPAQPGQKCRRQNAPVGSVDSDPFRAVDFVFGGGLDHHHIATFSRTVGRIALEVARRLAGLGELPDEPHAAVPAQLRQARIAVIGAGPAGLAAALGAAERARGVAVLEALPWVGGAAPLGLDPAWAGAKWVDETRAALQQKGAELSLRSEVVGLYSPAPGEGDGRALLAVRTPQGLVALRAERVVVACGGTAQPLAFPGVDRPGVYSARGLVALAQRHGVRVGAVRTASRKAPALTEPPRLAVLGEGRELSLCTQALQRAGYEIAVSAPADQAVRVRGNPASEVQLEHPGAPVLHVRCDAVALALPPSPLHELATGAGARARFDTSLGGFAVETDADGRTAMPWLFAAGRMVGRGGAAAVESGLAAGRAAAQGLPAEPEAAHV